MAKEQQVPFEDDNQKDKGNSNCNGNGRSRFPCGEWKTKKNNGNGERAEMMENSEELGEKMVTVARFTSPSEGQMALGALEAAGIDAFLQGENANSLYPGTFGERLLVSQKDEADAREILESAGDLEPGESMEDAGA